MGRPEPERNRDQGPKATGAERIVKQVQALGYGIGQPDENGGRDADEYPDDDRYAQKGGGIAGGAQCRVGAITLGLVEEPGQHRVSE